MCGGKRHTPEDCGWPAQREERNTPVREKPTASHKCGSVWGNGTVHGSRKNNTQLKSTTDCGDAPEENSEGEQSADAEPSRTKGSEPGQTVCGATGPSVPTLVKSSVQSAGEADGVSPMKNRFCLCAQDPAGHEPLLSLGLKPTSSLEDQTLHLTVRLQEGEEEEGQDEEMSGLINSDGQVVEWDSE